MKIDIKQKKECRYSKKKSTDKIINLRKITLTILFLIVILLPLMLLNTQKGITGMAADEPQFGISTLPQACGRLNESLTLTQNVGAGLLPQCFDINTSGITLNCAGYNITGNATGTAINITVSNGYRIENVTIQNCNIRNFSIGINISSATNISLFNNNITTVIDGNVIDGIWLNNTARSVLENNSANVTTGYGLYLSNSSNNTINNGNFSANAGSSSLYGIYLLSSNNNVLNNNTGKTASNSGIYFDSSSNNILTGNTGIAADTGGIYLSLSSNNTLTSNNGTASVSRGILLILSSNNTLTSNTGTANSQGIRLQSSSNNILTNNTGRGIAGIIGIAITSSSDNNVLTGNIGTTSSNSGFFIDLSVNNSLTGNTGTADNNYGIQFFNGGNNNVFLNNTFKSNSSAVYFFTGNNNNNFTNTTVIGNTGFLINGSNNIRITNTSFQNTNWSIQTYLGSNVTLVDNERMTNYSFNNTPSLTITKTGIASVNFFNIINANGTNLSMDVNLTTNKVHVNTSRSLGLNVTANITIFNKYTNPVRVAFNDRTFENCPPSVCSTPIASGSDMIFNVSHFTTYSSESVCQTVSTNITLGTNVNTSSSNCFDINTSGITLNCAGYNITGTATGTGINLTVSNNNKMENITIKNCNIQNFSIGINISSASNISLFNNNITNVTNGIWLNNTVRSVLENNSANVTTGYGLYLTNSSNNTINNGNFSTNRGADNSNGIYLLSSNNNVLNNNTGKSSLWGGIYLESSLNNILSRNIATAITNQAIYLISGSNNNNLTGNTATSLESNAISITNSNNNTLINNTATSNTDTSIRLVGSNNNILTGNTATAADVQGFYIYQSNNTILTNNIGVSNTNYALRLESRANYNVFLNNTFRSNGSAVHLIENSEGNNFTNTTVIGNTGFEIAVATNILITNTSFQNTNWSINLSSTGNVTLIDNERMTNYSFNNTPSLTITKTGIASVNFFNIINANGTNLSMDVNLTANNIHVNTSRSLGLNVTANITIQNITFTTPQIQVDFNDDGVFEVCTNCINLSYANNTFKFNISHFTTYKAIETPESPAPTPTVSGGGGGRASNIRIIPKIISAIPAKTEETLNKTTIINKTITSEETTPSTLPAKPTPKPESTPDITERDTKIRTINYITTIRPETEKYISKPARKTEIKEYSWTAIYILAIMLGLIITIYIKYLCKSENKANFLFKTVFTRSYEALLSSLKNASLQIKKLDYSKIVNLPIKFFDKYKMILQQFNKLLTRTHNKYRTIQQQLKKSLTKTQHNCKIIQQKFNTLLTKANQKYQIISQQSKKYIKQQEALTNVTITRINKVIANTRKVIKNNMQKLSKTIKQILSKINKE